MSPPRVRSEDGSEEKLERVSWMSKKGRGGEQRGRLARSSEGCPGAAES